MSSASAASPSMRSASDKTRRSLRATSACTAAASPAPARRTNSSSESAPLKDNARLAQAPLPCTLPRQPRRTLPHRSAGVVRRRAEVPSRSRRRDHREEGEMRIAAAPGEGRAQGALIANAGGAGQQCPQRLRLPLRLAALGQSDLQDLREVLL